MHQQKYKLKCKLRYVSSCFICLFLCDHVPSKRFIFVEKTYNYREVSAYCERSLKNVLDKNWYQYLSWKTTQFNCFLLFVLVLELCSYNGVLFRQGERWDDGCDLQCVCENETSGYYRCNQRFVNTLIQFCFGFFYQFIKWYAVLKWSH